MTKIYQKINNLNNSYYLERAENAGEQIMTIIKGDDVFDALYLYCSNDNINLDDIEDNEKDACLDLLESMLEASDDDTLTFSISE